MRVLWGYIGSTLEYIESTLGHIWHTFALLGVYWVIFGSAMTYILFESNLLIIWSTWGYFVSTVGYVGSTLDYMWSTLSYVGYVGCTPVSYTHLTLPTKRIV